MKRGADPDLGNTHGGVSPPPPIPLMKELQAQESEARRSKVLEHSPPPLQPPPPETSLWAEVPYTGLRGCKGIAGSCNTVDLTLSGPSDFMTACIMDYSFCSCPTCPALQLYSARLKMATLLLLLCSGLLEPSASLSCTSTTTAT